MLLFLRLVVVLKYGSVTEMVTFLNFYIKRHSYENTFMKRYKLCLEKIHPFYIHLFLKGLLRARLCSRHERTLLLVQSHCTQCFKGPKLKRSEFGVREWFVA